MPIVRFATKVHHSKNSKFIIRNFVNDSVAKPFAQATASLGSKWRPAGRVFDYSIDSGKDFSRKLKPQATFYFFEIIDSFEKFGFGIGMK